MQKFYFISNEQTDPYYNLATEEFLLKKTDGFYIYLWINDRAVIVGKNQNALEEVNLSYTEQNDIKVVRRLTGGGTVYHDKGNLCYTVIAPYQAEQDNYKVFTAPVIEYLKSLGVNAEFSGRNDIVIDGKKISGNAQTIYRDKIMHHGTILFDTDGSELEKCLNPSKLKMQSKGIKSVRARVTNVKEHLPSNINIEEFKKGLRHYLLKNSQPYELTKEQQDEIALLVKEKYSTYEWNIGSSPVGKNQFTNKFDFGIFTLNFDTENGCVKNANITGDFFELKDVGEFATSLNGTRFSYQDFLTAFENVKEYISGSTAEVIVNKIFE